MKHSVAIIGVGTVGSEIAYSIIAKNIASELILLDKDRERCAAQVRDLTDSLSFSFTGTIMQGTYAEVRKANIIIIAAGRPQQEGESRLQLIESNKNILDEVAANLKGIQKNAIVIVVTNPLDILTFCLLKELDLPRRQIFGTGTYLDSQRLRALLSQKLSIGRESILATVLGEHGDSQVVAWSATTIAGLPVSHFISAQDKQEMEEQVREAAYTIIAGKGATCYGIASCVASLCRMIFYDTKDIVPVSWYQSGFGVCMSMPTIVGQQGIESVIPFELPLDEHERLKTSADTLKKYLAMVSD